MGLVSLALMTLSTPQAIAERNDGAVDGALIGQEPQSAPVISTVANGRRYDLVQADNGLTWEQARSFAQSMRAADLVTITSFGENTLVWNLAQSGLGLGPGSRFWLGGFTESVPGDVISAWITGEPFEFMGFAAGQPDGPAGSVFEMDVDWGEWWDTAATDTRTAEMPVCR